MRALTLNDLKDLHKHLEHCKLKAIINGLEQENKYLICTQETFDMVFPGFVKSKNIKIVNPQMLPKDTVYIMDKEPPIMMLKA